MSESDRLLDLIEKGIVAHGGDLGGWVRRSDGALQLFDGRVTLRAELKEARESGSNGEVHAHVFASLHEYDNEMLDACLYGIANDRAGALEQVATLWITAVAGPIRSFIDDRPVCMTCQAGVAGGDVSRGYSEGNYGLPNVRAYVGPAIERGFADKGVLSSIDDTKPWFRFAVESAAPRRAHLAKVLIVGGGTAEGWRRELEIDGHDVAHHDPDWPAGVQNAEPGYLTRFAVFEFPPHSAELLRRAELERTIRHFAENYTHSESVNRLMEDMVRQGFDPDLVHDVESISTIAFGRLLFEPRGVQYSSSVIRARKDGRVEVDVPLMAIPAYSRARAIGARLLETMNAEDFRRLCLYSAESNAIVKGMEAAGDKVDFSKFKLYPSIVPDRGVSDRTMDAAVAHLNGLIGRKREPTTKKPWWKVW
jgi:hypothetical protein